MPDFCMWSFSAICSAWVGLETQRCCILLAHTVNEGAAVVSLWRCPNVDLCSGIWWRHQPIPKEALSVSQLFQNQHWCQEWWNHRKSGAGSMSAAYDQLCGSTVGPDTWRTILGTNVCSFWCVCLCDCACEVLYCYILAGNRWSALGQHHDHTGHTLFINLCFHIGGLPFHSWSMLCDLEKMLQSRSCRADRMDTSFTSISALSLVTIQSLERHRCELNPQSHNSQIKSQQKIAYCEWLWCVLYTAVQLTIYVWFSLPYTRLLLWCMRI